MTDISDGFLLDLGRVCDASGVGAEVWLDGVPVGSGRARSEESEKLALTGGEEFELLAAIPDHLVRQLSASWNQGLPPLSRLGVLTAEKGIRLLKGPGGEPVDPPDGDGFQHF